MSTATFQPRVLAALAAALCALFAASLLLTGAGGPGAVGNAFGANSYSRSAVGHLAFYELVQGVGHKAVRGEHQSLAMLVQWRSRPGRALRQSRWRGGSQQAPEREDDPARPAEMERARQRAAPGLDRRSGAGAALRAQAVRAVANGGDIVRMASPASYQKTVPSPIRRSMARPSHQGLAAEAPDRVHRRHPARGTAGGGLGASGSFRSRPAWIITASERSNAYFAPGYTSPPCWRGRAARWSSTKMRNSTASSARHPTF